MKEEIKIGMVIDDHKIKNKNDWWAKSLAGLPHIEKDYYLVEETSGPGLTKDTTNFYRTYRLKSKNENSRNR